MPLSEEERARHDRNRPRPFILEDADERARLLRETAGYAYTSLHKKDGTDLQGREYAYYALRRALDAGYILVKP